MGIDDSSHIDYGKRSRRHYSRYALMAWRRVFLSKPSRNEEAWSFAQAKVPKLNASERSRWNGVSVFVGKGRHHAHPD